MTLKPSLCHLKSLKMVSFESLGTVFYLHTIATVAVCLAVSARYTNVTSRQPASCTHGAIISGAVHSKSRRGAGPAPPTDGWYHVMNMTATGMCRHDGIDDCNRFRLSLPWLQTSVQATRGNKVNSGA